MKELLLEIIEAGEGSNNELNMITWVGVPDNECGYSCCLCGDVAIKRDPQLGVRNLSNNALEFSHELDNACMKIFGGWDLAESICRKNFFYRLDSAEDSGLLTKEELKHPHLNEDHNNREIAHDYIRLIIKKIEERENENQ